MGWRRERRETRLALTPSAKERAGKVRRASRTRISVRFWEVVLTLASPPIALDPALYYLVARPPHLG